MKLLAQTQSGVALLPFPAAEAPRASFAALPLRWLSRRLLNPCHCAIKTALLVLASILPFPASADLLATQPAADSGAPLVVERGSDYAVVQHVTSQVKADGSTVTTTNTYTALETGMHFFKDGTWLESQELIQVAADGSAAYAAQGPSQAIFSANANSIPCVDLLTSDSNRLQSHVLGLAYYDAASGKSVMIAETKDAVGQLLPPNQILYPDAMTDFTCDIRYTYRKCGLEQDIILRQQPPPPQTFGLDPASTRLQVWTEFFDAPSPQIQRRMIYQEPDPAVRQAMVQPDWTDDYLDFGAMHIGLGRAFSLDGTDSLIVLKEWLTISNRTCLVESLSYAQVKPSLDAIRKVLDG